MNNFFYCIGFIYLMEIFYNIYWDFKPFTKEELEAQKNNPLVIDENITMHDLHKEIGTMEAKENAKSSYEKIKSLLYSSLRWIFLGWAVMGFIYCINPEKKFYIVDLIAVVSSFLLTFSIGVVMTFYAYKNVNSINPKIYNTKNDNKKKSIKIFLIHKIKHTLELIAISGILIHHFLM